MYAYFQVKWLVILNPSIKYIELNILSYTLVYHYSHHQHNLVQRDLSRCLVVNGHALHMDFHHFHATSHFGRKMGLYPWTWLWWELLYVRLGFRQGDPLSKYRWLMAVTWCREIENWTFPHGRLEWHTLNTLTKGICPKKIQVTMRKCQAHSMLD